MSRGCLWRVVASSLVVSGLACLPMGTDAHGAPPDPSTLFACPLAGSPDAFEPPRGWTRHRLPSLGLSVATPARWTREGRGSRVVLHAASRRARLRVTRVGGSAPAAPLAAAGAPLRAIRAAHEALRLGPPHAHPRCMDRVARALPVTKAATHAELAVYGRPLGEARRTIAFWLVVPEGDADDSVVLAELTVWYRGRPEPDWATIRRLLGGIELTETEP